MCANLTKVSLELGGNPARSSSTRRARSRRRRSPIGELVQRRQICNALTRVLVPERRHDEYVDALAAEIRNPGG